MRIGPRHDRHCERITTADGREIHWVDEVRYLGIVVVRFFKFKCSVDHAKRSFFRAANGIYAKVGRLVSEEVISQLLKSKCLPVLLYGLVVCTFDKRALQSPDFAFNKFLMKLFKTTNV